MKIIETLSDKISEEIHDARCYVKMALQYRDEYPELARTLYGISQEEMGHMDRLHQAVTDMIKAYRKANGEPPEKMMVLYEYLHGQQIDRAAEVNAMQSMFRKQE